MFLFLWASQLNASPIWVASELKSAAASQKCTFPLEETKQIKEASPGFLSRSLEEINSNEIDRLAKDSTRVRFNAIECLRNLKQSPEDRKEFVQDLRISNQREDILFKAEFKRLLAKERSYSLTLSEAKLAIEWAKERDIIADSIRSITEKALLLPNSEWKKETLDLTLELKARYGALLRIRETFFFSLSPETREAYQKEFLTKD